ncbi:MAG TPA: EAL domain-containing protein [Terracidiphilus sp.]|jgi:diguanylate cyclase (GGDEF)-like protein/PAS domain S-box-containing protein|nr:EAL domain-containing protein [Terracidiphilus sp.]
MAFAPEMQEIVVDVSVLALFVFLFSVMSIARQDNRLRCWTAGWLFVVAHFAVEIWLPARHTWQVFQECISVDALALAGTCFVYSATIYRSKGRFPRWWALLLIALTLASLDLAISGSAVSWILASVVEMRQTLAIVLIVRGCRNRLKFAAASCLVCLATGAWMLAGIEHGRPEIVIYALLGEIYFVSAIDFLSNGWHNSPALKAMIGGFVAWGAVFPVGYLLSVLWPHLAIDREVWNVPKFCVAVGMILVVTDEDTRAVRALGEDYRLLFDENPEPFWITEVATLRFLAVNQAALDLHGYTREEFLKMSLVDVLHPDMRDLAISYVRSPAVTPQHRASRHFRKDGTSFPLDVTAQEIVFQGKRCRFVMALDVTEREQLQQQLDHQAGHDRLTGLPNRMLLPDLLAKAVKHAVDSKEKLAVLSLDMDRFKRVNEVYGLRIGDECIERLAGLFASRMRSMDVIARTGGDEFTIVVTGLKSKVTAEQAVHDLMEALAQPLIVQGYKIDLPMSIGVAVGPEDGVDALALWRGAELARAEAKASGGSTAAWFSTELRKAAEEQVELEAYLRTRMDEGGLHLAYQPIYGLDGTVRSMEALLRLNHPDFGEVSPVKLIPIAEAAGLIIPLGEWVIEEACRQLLIWKSQGVPLVPVAVNVSGLQIVHVDFASRYMATLERYAIDPRLMNIEVTETVAMRNVADVTEQMKALSVRGIEFSIDDFGTGHSSLARLRHLGASILKIDKSFMTPGCTENAHTIVQAIITMAHTLGHQVVAEGVESEHQMACLRELHCDLFQGYLLSRPVSPDQIPALLGTIHPAFEAKPVPSESLRLVERAHA